MSLQKILDQRKKRKEAETMNLNQLVLNTVSEMTDKMFSELKQKIEVEVKNAVSNEINKSEEARNKVLDLQSKVKDGKSIVGPQGSKGDKGSTGIQGLKGSTGIAGKIGKDGKDGSDGKNGVGIKGDTGNDGSPDNPEEIADKLNTLTEKVEYKVIKGLDQTLSTMRSSIREAKKGGGKKGGGMGPVQHESFSLTTATSSVTLEFKVAAKGLAIFVKYQGKNVSVNDATGYSISGQEINLNFTPNNNTFLDVIYWSA